MDNNDRVIEQINKDIEKALEYTAEQATWLLLDFVDKYVYEWGAKMKEEAANKYFQTTAYWKGNRLGEHYVDSEGHRGYRLTHTSHDKYGNFTTGQFRSSIKYHALSKAMGDYITFQIFSDPSEMILDAQTHLHGSSSGGDKRSVLLEHLDQMIGDYMPKDRDVKDWTSSPDGHPAWRWWSHSANPGGERYHFFSEKYLDELDKKIDSYFVKGMLRVGGTGLTIAAGAGSGFTKTRE